MNPQLQALLQQAIQAFQGGNFTKAEEALQYFLNVKPTEFDALHLLAIVYASQNKHDKALEWYEKALNIIPNDASALSNYASSLSAIGRNQEALNILNKVLEINPSDSVFFYNIANTLCELERYEESLFYYEKSIKLDPQHFQAHNNYGKSLYDLKRYSESLIHYDNAILINPFFIDCLLNKGVSLNELKRYDEAIAHYDKALSLQPEYAEGWSNKGITLHELKRYNEAIAHYDKALSLKPDYAEAWSNKGNTLHNLQRCDDAIAHYDKALSLKPDYAEASWNKSLSLLLQGDFKNGLPLYEYRWNSEKASEAAGKRSFQQPTWLGDQSLQDKTILLYGEQGLGDFIQFCRYVKLVADLGAKVILETPESLASLMKNLEGVSQLIIKGIEEMPYFDYQCPLLSLPLALNTEISSIPAKIPYLTAHQDKIVKWSLRLGEKRKKRVGLAWSSVSNFKDDSKRSLMLIDFVKALSNNDNFEYICLQKELKDCDKIFFRDYKNIRFFGDELVDFSDTAGLIENLDLVISTCTSIPHLSGALGKKTWILLSHAPDWRWLLDREDSPWYPSVKLYRQSIIGDWNNVFEKVKSDLNSTNL